MTVFDIHFETIFTTHMGISNGDPVWPHDWMASLVVEGVLVRDAEEGLVDEGHGEGGQVGLQVVTWGRFIKHSSFVSHHVSAKLRDNLR